MRPTLHIRDFTDPTCPFAYSLEPVRWRLKWLYGEQITWESSMIVLSETVDPDGPLTPELIAKNMTKLRGEHGMPMNDTPRPRLSASIDTCRAYVATLLNAPAKADRVLRELRTAVMGGALADEPATVMAAVKKCGINEIDFQEWLKQAAVEERLRADMKAARTLSRVALVLKHKLGGGGSRYSAGSYVFSREDKKAVFELPGFWPLTTYEAVMANIAPELSRRDDASSAQEVLQWATQPLATAEVAAIRNQPVEQVRKELDKIATFNPIGQDGFWLLSQ